LGIDVFVWNQIGEVFMKRYFSRSVFTLLCIAGASLWAQGMKENRVVYWSAADLRGTESKELTPQAKAATSGIGSKTFMDLRTHKVMMAHREKPGTPELHKGETDVFVIESGGGILQVGGEIVDRKDSAAGATGASIRGGENHTMAAGDVINIPPNVPHNWLLTPGQSVTYFIVKVEEPR
jgi:mannose-6-phosphate isomerase-like protein (cupin superfamily)